jgi:hypothetical protein
MITENFRPALELLEYKPAIGEKLSKHYLPENIVLRPLEAAHLSYAWRLVLVKCFGEGRLA